MAISPLLEVHESPVGGSDYRINSVPKHNPSFVLDPNLSFSYEDREIPQIQDSRDIIVRVVATGVCGSDVSLNDRLRYR